MTDRAIADVTTDTAVSAVSATTTPEQLAQAAQRALRGNLAKEGEKLARQGKLFVRDRLALLLDEGSFIEDALLANASAEDLPADGVVTGVGVGVVGVVGLSLLHAAAISSQPNIAMRTDVLCVIVASVPMWTGRGACVTHFSH